MVATETYLNVRETCGARRLPNGDAAVLYEIPKGTDVKFLRDEDRDFIKVAYEGRPVYVPREAITAPVVLPTAEERLAEGHLEGSFALRTNRDAWLNVVQFVSNGAAHLSWIALMTWGFTQGDVRFLVIELVALGIFVVLWTMGQRAVRPERTFVDVHDDALVIGKRDTDGVTPLRDGVIPLKDIEAINDKQIDAWHVLMIAFDALLLPIPGRTRTRTLAPYPSTRMLQLTLSKARPLAPWAFGTRYRKVLFDPEDRPGFLAAARKSAPQVPITSALAAAYGVPV